MLGIVVGVDTACRAPVVPGTPAVQAAAAPAGAAVEAPLKRAINPALLATSCYKIRSANQTQTPNRSPQHAKIASVSAHFLMLWMADRF